MAIPVTNTILVLPGDFGDAGFGSQPYQTYAEQRFEITPASASAAFAAARDALGGTGGSLWISPGTQVYNLDTEVDWGVRPTELIFAPGARLALGAGAANGFRFKARTRVEGLEVIDNWADGASRSFIYLDGSAGSNVLTDVELVRCHFSMTAAGANVADARCIRAAGFSSSDRNGRLVLEECSLVSRGGTQQAWSWVGEETSGAGTNKLTGVPYGVGLLTASNWRHVELTGCRVRGRQTGLQYLGTPLLFDNCDAVLVNGLTGSDWSGESVGSICPLLVARASAGVDSTLVVDETFVELMHLDHAIAVTGNVSAILMENQVGRLLGAKVASAFHAKDVAELLFLENATHNVTGSLLPNSLVVNGAGAVSVLDNAATLRKNSTRSFEVTAASNVLMRGNLSETQDE